MDAIARGRQPAGSALPPIRQLAVDLGVNFHTVNKGYDLLRQEGLLRLGRKSGAVVRRDAGSGPPDPGWARDWAGRLRTLLAEAAAQGMPATGIAAECEAGSAGSLAGIFPVLSIGALMCSMPAVTRPTVQFGIRVPRERAGAPVIRRERRAYYWRTAAIGVCCTVVSVTTRDYGSWWLSRAGRG